MSETHATTPVFPPGRYGRRREGRHSRWLPILATVLSGLVILGLTMQLYNKFGEGDYDPQIIGWSEPSDTEMVIQFRVLVPAGENATCMLRARDYDGFEVGRQLVTVQGKPGGGSVEVSEPVTTKSRASVGDVMGCRAAG
ncbi:DUF4307 domain-containing protein [Actinoplanes sp. DH11]|uniref:DUF4307 domain-containing protein n=1 Tax=Actinoplanes sp. DH11 TaxID=2857011 RepID=UPI001E4163D4|nr:DUF4307 domain-containing protein [Actinoplanes sp. DH11]